MAAFYMAIPNYCGHSSAVTLLPGRFHSTPARAGPLCVHVWGSSGPLALLVITSDRDAEWTTHRNEAATVAA